MFFHVDVTTMHSSHYTKITMLGKITPGKGLLHRDGESEEPGNTGILDPRGSIPVRRWFRWFTHRRDPLGQSPN